jgi:SP family general alpha glucoside:H+ symporter-like MFS transporter
VDVPNSLSHPALPGSRVSLVVGPQGSSSIIRLGNKTTLNASEAVAMMRRTVDLEKSIKEPNLIELWKGTDLYRTLIVCGVYAAQNLTGNLIANQAVYFFKRK